MGVSDIKSTVPAHLGLILDGNRRWAAANGLPKLEGHRKGYDNLKDIAKAAFERGVSFVSAFVFSTENWNRTAEEVKYLMNLAHRVLTRDVQELNKENIKVVWLGSRERVSPKLLKAIAEAEASTKGNTKGTLCLCFNYGGQDEIVEAVRKLMVSGGEVTKETFAGALYQPTVPPIDLLIRTSGEYRTSGFMLWRAAYAELYFTEKYWPDFTTTDLDAALAEYGRRERRFGE